MTNLKSKKPIERRYYDVKVEVQLPAIITYRVYAETPEEALLLAERASPNHVKHNLHQKKVIKAQVYLSGTSMLKFVKNFFR
jgi:hypothetical protein